VLWSGDVVAGRGDGGGASKGWLVGERWWGRPGGVVNMGMVGGMWGDSGRGGHVVG
jgi:hypothetical protein